MHNVCDGALLASHKVANGCFNRIRDNNVAASPHHLYLAMTYREDPQKAFHQLTPYLLGALQHDGVLDGTEREEVVEEAMLQADIYHWTIVLDLSTRTGPSCTRLNLCSMSVHPVAHARCLNPTNWRPSLDWAPDGLTVACSGGDYDDDLNFWHGPSASVISTFQGCNLRERENSTCPFSQHWLTRTRPCLSHLPKNGS